MSNKNYTIYHLHSDLSNGITNIDSVTKYYEYIEEAKELGMTALGFSEHGCILEWVHKKNKIEAAGMKYIHAEEFYITEELYHYPVVPDEIYKEFQNVSKEEFQKKINEYLEKNKFQVRDNYHCVLIAKNEKGVEELNELSSIAFKRDGHFYYNPRISFKELVNTSDNILITTACLGGILASENKSMQEKFLKFCIDNKDRCYLEIQHHKDDKQIQYNKYLAKISEKYDIPLIAGTDTHCLNKKHEKGRYILQKAKKTSFPNEANFNFLFLSYDELVEAYKIQNALSEDVYLKAIEETNRMADRIKTFELDYTKKYPKLYEDSLGTLKQKIIQGIKKRGINKYPNFQEYKNRIQYELKTYIHNEAIDFVLLEEDYKTALKKQGVEFGYSRGSVSGSVIAYILGITEVDSIKFNLNFERFMNTERVSLADVDTDWYKEDRWKVREYLFQKEGLHCCNIITFNTIKMRGAIKDVGRALGMTPEQTQAICNQVQKEDKKEFIPDNIRKQYKELFDYVDIVSGTITSLGRHAAGLVVAPHDIDYKFGTLYISSDDKPISQINMKEIDSLNYVKLDVLGLDCVGLIYKTCEAAGIDFLTPDNMDFDDIEVWEDIANDTTLIFQFESEFAGNYLKDILRDSTIKKIKEKNPNFSYIDLMSMANGAIRPAGSSYRNELSQGIYRDNGHPALNEFLAPTLGYLVYQEQIIAFLHQFCGFTMGEADVVRRHFSKKTGTENDIPVIKNGGYLLNADGNRASDHYIDGFIKTMNIKYGVLQEESENLIGNFLQVIIDASDYLFSQNHADPYSFLGFACGYLRHYYPLETFTEALNIYAEDTGKSIKIKDYIASKGYEIKPIKFGYSGAEYMCDKDTNTIYQGIGSIKFCNKQIAAELLELSKQKQYKDFIELLKDINLKTSVDARQLEILIGLNFFSQFGHNKYLMNIVELYNKLATAKIISKKKLEELGLTEFLMKKYAGRETASQYRDLDNEGLIFELASRLENKPMSVVEQVKFEKEYLQYVVYSNPRVNHSFYIVTDYKTFKEVRKPYCTLHNIKTGEDIKTRVTSVKTFENNPFGEYSILRVNGFTKKHKKKCINGTWQETEELEDILDNYEVIRNE